MLMHTRGILIQTHDGAMVLTGKRALDYSGGVSADYTYALRPVDDTRTRVSLVADCSARTTAR